MTKILLLNMPSGPCATEFPPVGVLRVVEGVDPALKAEVLFMDIDWNRRTFAGLREDVAKFSPDIIGFSAILTPAYKYLKELSIYLKEQFPGAVQVLGGEMGVLADIILNRTKVDFCVIGDAEPTFNLLIAQLQRAAFKLEDKRPFGEIKELAFMLDGYAFFTGYDETKRPELRQPNYELLEKFTSLDHYMQPVDGQFFRNHINKHHLPQFYAGFYPGNAQKKTASMFASQGCVGRCTYCHRYFKGYVMIDPDKVNRTIDELCAKYDIGMIRFEEENFGYVKRTTQPILEHLKKRKLNWGAPCIRAETIKEDVIKEWKASGCVHLGFGIESCSAKMLKVMEKRMTVEQNLNAIRLCAKYDIFSQIDLVIGLPGETDETVQETVDALSTVLPETFGGPYEIAVQWFLAVPGTPGYEFARAVGRIGPTLDDEEKYILGLYEITANDVRHYLNFTDGMKEEVVYWKDFIFLELVGAYMKKHGRLKVLRHSKAPRFKYAALYMLFPPPVRKWLLKYIMVAHYYGFGHLLRFLAARRSFKRTDFFRNIEVSLRKLLKTMALPVRDDDKYTHVLRQGR